MRNQEGIKIELQKKAHRRTCVRDIIFLTARPLFYVIFCCILRLIRSPSQVTCLLNGPSKDTYQKYENLIQFNTSWWASLATWYYFRFCFTFICSGYDLTLIKKNDTLNCYSFLQKFLLKTKPYKLVVGNSDSSVYS